VREEHRLRMFENIALRKIFGPKRDKVTGEWRKLHNEEFIVIRVMQSRRMRWEEQVARMGEGRAAFRFLVGKPEGKKLLGRSRPRWKNNTQMYLQEFGWAHGLDGYGSGWEQVVGSLNAVMNIRVP
jgi:hypothetical protein